MTTTMLGGGPDATVEAEVRDLVDTVRCNPEVSARQRSEVQGLAGDLLRDQARTNGLNLQVFAAAGVSLGVSYERPATPARTCTADDSAWFDEVGIRGRERRDEELECRYFDRVREVGADIERCCDAIGEVLRTAETAVRCLLAPVRRTLEVVLRCGFTQLVQPTVDLAIEALTRARDATRDRNCVIEQCLEGIAQCVDEAAQHTPAPPVQFESGTGQHKPADAGSRSDAKLQAGTVGTTAASAPGFDVAFNFGGDARLEAKLDAKFDAKVDAKVDVTLPVRGLTPPPLPQVPPVLKQPGAMIGAFGAIGAVAALGALECFTSSVECPPCPCPPEAPAPAPEPAPAPPPAPEPPAPEPTTTPTGSGVIEPPPELAQVPEPAAPEGKVAHMQTAAAPETPVQPAAPAAPEAPTVPEAPAAQAASAGQDDAGTKAVNAAGEDPWAVKKMGEW